MNSIIDILTYISDDLKPKLHYILVHNNKIDENVFSQIMQTILQVLGETLEKKDYEIALACAKHFKDLTQNDIIKPEVWDVNKKYTSLSNKSEY